MEVSLPIWSKKDCQNVFIERIGDDVLCAGAKEGGRDSCQVCYELSVRFFHHDNFYLNLILINSG